MKKLGFLLTLVVIFLLFPTKCMADEQMDKYISDYEDALPEDFSDIGGEGRAQESLDFYSILSYIGEALSGEGGRVGIFFALLVGATALLSLSSTVGKLSPVAESVVGICLSLPIFSSLYPIIRSVEDGITKLNLFFSSLIPIAAGVNSLGGAVSTASVQAAGMYTALNLVSGLGGRIFLSLSSLGLALALISAIGGDEISAVLSGVKGLFGWITGICTALMTALFALQSLVSSATDSASIRAIRYAASSLIPVVGSTVSGAVGTLSSGLSYAKGVIGGGAVAVIIYMAISPLALLLIYRLALSLALIISNLSGSKTASKIFTAFRFSLDMTVTVYALSALIYLFDVVVFTTVGGDFL